MLGSKALTFSTFQVTTEFDASEAAEEFLAALVECEASEAPKEFPLSPTESSPLSTFAVAEFEAVTYSSTVVAPAPSTKDSEVPSARASVLALESLYYSVLDLSIPSKSRIYFCN